MRGPKTGLAVLLAVVAVCLLTAGVASAAPLERALVFSETAGFRHDSIPAGITAIQELGAANGFAVDATEDSTQFNDTNLAQYQAVIFLSTTGDVLSDTEQAAFERYIAAGNGYVGIHAAADTEYDWGWYGDLVGAYFAAHPPGHAHRLGRRRGRHARLHDDAFRPAGRARTSGTTTSRLRPAPHRGGRLQPALRRPRARASR